VVLLSFVVELLLMPTFAEVSVVLDAVVTALCMLVSVAVLLFEP
jgi:hypothetical protein